MELHRFNRQLIWTFLTHPRGLFIRIDHKIYRKEYFDNFLPVHKFLHNFTQNIINCSSYELSLSFKNFVFRYIKACFVNFIYILTLQRIIFDCFTSGWKPWYVHAVQLGNLEIIEGGVLAKKLFFYMKIWLFIGPGCIFSCCFGTKWGNK